MIADTPSGGLAADGVSAATVGAAAVRTYGRAPKRSAARRSTYVV